jgi:hypothetical protein
MQQVNLELWLVRFATSVPPLVLLHVFGRPVRSSPQTSGRSVSNSAPLFDMPSSHYVTIQLYWHANLSLRHHTALLTCQSFITSPYSSSDMLSSHYVPIQLYWYANLSLRHHTALLTCQALITSPYSSVDMPISHYVTIQLYWRANLSLRHHTALLTC